MHSTKQLIFLLLAISSHSLWARTLNTRTVEEVVALYEIAAEDRLIPHFEQAGVAYPPAEVAFIAMKREKKVALWAKKEKHWYLINSYAMRTSSGHLGPKLRQGDKQIPEGIYRVIALNPNSSYHLSMKLNYPNAFDWLHANQEGRYSPGSNIFIHGRAVSIGCLAMGDSVIEELFILVHKVGLENVQVIISPWDTRKDPLTVSLPAEPEWLPTLYEQIDHAIKKIYAAKQTALP